MERAKIIEDDMLRFTISSVNTLVGHSLFEELRNDHIAIHKNLPYNKFYGTMTNKFG